MVTRLTKCFYIGGVGYVIGYTNLTMLLYHVVM